MVDQSDMGWIRHGFDGWIHQSDMGSEWLRSVRMGVHDLFFVVIYVVRG